MTYFAAILGMFAFVGIGYAVSTNRKKINWQTIGWAAGLQILFAVFVLKTKIGQIIFAWLNKFILAVLDCQLAGAEMVFGSLAKADTLGYIFAFQVLPTIIFFSALMSFLYYIGVMQKIVRVFSWIMEKTCKISGAESLSAAANIFVGQTEAPLLIKPYVDKMTMSELMCVMTGGMATVAGGVMAAYITLLRDFMPNIAGHLIAASVMGAPAAVMFAKLMVPETETPQTMGVKAADYKDPSSNILEAVSNGTTTGLQLALNVAAMLIAFTALIALANAGVVWLTGFFIDGGVTIEQILGYVFAPFVWLMGVPPGDLVTAGRLIGEKTILNEFIAYANFADILKSATAAGTTAMSQHTEVILSYALCGFANFASIGIQIGGIGSIAPGRRGDLSKLGFRSMAAGLLSSCFRAAVAGILVAIPFMLFF